MSILGTFHLIWFLCPVDITIFMPFLFFSWRTYALQLHLLRPRGDIPQYFTVVQPGATAHPCNWMLIGTKPETDTAVDLGQPSWLSSQPRSYTSFLFDYATECLHASPVYKSFPNVILVFRLLTFSVCSSLKSDQMADNVIHSTFFIVLQSVTD